MYTRFRLLFAAAAISLGLTIPQSVSVHASLPRVAATDTGRNATNTTKTVKYTTANLNVREGAGTDTKIINVLPKGTPVSVVSESTGWSLLSGGRYVCSKYLKNVPVWKAVKTNESEYTDKARSTEPTSIKILNFEKATTLNKQQKIVEYMSSNSGTHYYTVDESAEEGAIVAGLAVGDIISINEDLIRISGEMYADYTKDTNALKLWEEIDFATCIQTCVPPYNGAIVIKYGHVVQVDD